LISLKRHIDAEYTSSTLLKAMSDAYQATLTAVSAGAARACRAVAVELEPQLGALGGQMAAAETPDAIAATATRIVARVREWGDCAGDDLDRKTADVKELLVTLAHTAASVAASDAEHVMRFDALTARLERIATLDDVTELRGAVLTSASELRASVEAMSTSTRQSLKALQSELDTYQSKLEAAEAVAGNDPLTGLLNRRKIDTIIERRIERGQPFSLGLIDLDGFKGVNDRVGHRGGDQLLLQFSADLKANARPSDLVGRWGGDEFIVIIDGVGDTARTHFKRVQQWVGGSYAVDGPHGKVKVHIDLSIGIAEWQPGLTASDVIEEADRRMYAAKRAAR
jgi:diguanylate cyclase